MLPRTRSRTAVIPVVALAAFLLTTGAASAQADRDCPDFPDRAAAQAALDSRVGDPERLDADHDGSACEDFPYSTFTGPRPSPSTAGSAPPQVSQVPVGAVDAGDGSASLASLSLTTPLARAGGIAFVAGMTLVVLLVVAGLAGLVLTGRMLRRVRWHR